MAEQKYGGECRYCARPITEKPAYWKVVNFVYDYLDPPYEVTNAYPVCRRCGE